jgi:hypothetical protein
MDLKADEERCKQRVCAASVGPLRAGSESGGLRRVRGIAHQEFSDVRFYRLERPDMFSVILELLLRAPSEIS